MKTYEEALALVARKTSTPAESKSACAAMIQGMESRLDLVEQIANDHNTQMMLVELVRQVVEDGGESAVIAMAIWINGVMVGIEMERDDSRVGVEGL